MSDIIRKGKKEKGDDFLPEKIYHYRSWFAKIAALAIVSEKGVILEINDLFTRLYGYSREEIVGKRISCLKSGSTTAEVHQQMWEAVSSGWNWSGELENKKKSGDSVYVRATLACANTGDSSEGPRDFMAIYQDITPEVLRRERDKEQAIDAARQSMLAGALHNIGNLQQAVSIANTSVLNQARELVNLFDKAKDAFESISDKENRNNFIESLFNVTKQALGQIEVDASTERQAILDTINVLEGFRRHQRNILHIESVPLQEFLRRLLNVFNMRIMGKGINLDVSSNFDPKLMVTWPTDRVHQVVFNLMKNAEDAVSERMRVGAHAHGKILLGVRVSNAPCECEDRVVFSIADNGGGFDVPENQLFEQGFTTKSYGVGIGLHNSVLVTQSFNGKLRASNGELNGQIGATFELSLPIVIENAEDAQKTVQSP